MLSVIEAGPAAVTVIVVLPLTLPLVALIVEVPAFNALARPEALIVAVVVLEDAHVAVVVRFCVVPSLYVPVAVNCCVPPAATDGFTGVTAIELSVAAVTVSVVEPVTLPLVALIVEVPAFNALARPEALIVAVVVLEDAHVAVVVRFCVVPSLYVPVAVNCCVPPAATDGFTGVTAIELSVAAVTVSVVEPVTLPLVALIVEVPAFNALARPEALIVAVVVLEDAHVAVVVRFCVVPSLYVPVAVNCCVPPAATDGFTGVTAIELSVAAVTVSVVEPVTLPLVALIVEVPAFNALARPEALIVAVVVLEDAHVAVVVRFCVVPSLYVPVAVNCCVPPAATDGFTGVTAIELSVAAVTVSVVEPVTLPLVALIVEVPAFNALARPEALIVAVVVLEDAHVAVVVRFCVVPSLYVPVAVNCCVPPAATDGFTGVTAIELSVAAVTVSVVEPVTLPLVALIVEVPAFNALARPEALIVAVVVLEDAHVALLVKFCVVPSLYVPVAVNCCVPPAATDGFTGVTAIELSVAAVTVSVVEPVTLPLVALIVEVPAFNALARPEALIVAVVVLEDAHVALLVRFCVVPSLYVPVAVNCCVPPAATDGFTGVTAIELSVAAVTVSVVEPVTLPLVALIVEVPAFNALARPEALIVAVVVLEDAHVAVVVKFCVVPSLYVPVAVNCCVPPAATDGFTGVTAIELSVAAVTVSVVEPVTLPLVALIVEVPAFNALARPEALIVAVVVLEDAHVAVVVRFCVVPSLYVPVAVNCCVPPAATDGFTGVTAIELSVAAVTVSVVEPVTLPLVALIVEVPAFNALARPEALIVAVVVLEDAHVAVVVRFCVVPSLYVPVAVNCCVPPAATDGFTGVTAIELSIAAVTVSVVEPVTLPLVALIVEVPAFNALARPEALIVAVVVLEDAHVAVVVRFCVVPSLYVPVAVNCCVPPAATDGFTGVTAIELSVAAVTVSVVEPVTLPLVALIVEVPAFNALARPEALIVAVVVLEDAHVAVVVRFCVVPSLYVPVAVNCCVPPAATDGFTGVTAIELSVAAVTVSVVEPVTLPLVALIVEVPAFNALARPEALIVAVVVLEDAHVTVVVRFCVVPSLYVPVAVNCCVPPAATDGFTGVTAIELSVAAVTVSVVEPVTLPLVALIVEVPAFNALARPEALIVAVVVLEDAHVTVLVRFCVVPSLYVPVAVNCCVPPAATDGFTGVTAIELSVAAVTVSVVEPVTLPLVALIVEVPAFNALARPEALIVAVVVLEDAHVTLLVRFCVVPSLYVPVAVNCCVPPAATDGFTGVTAIELSVAAVTVSVVEPVTLPLVALIVEVPAFNALARPEALIVAVVVLEDAHVTVLVRFCVVLSLYVPVAVNCCVPPAATDGFAGVTAIELSVAAVTVSVVEPVTLPLVALIVEVPAFNALARPEALIVAVVVLEDAHVAVSSGSASFCRCTSLSP